jgi:hypothetical protein
MKSGAPGLLSRSGWRRADLAHSTNNQVIIGACSFGRPIAPFVLSFLESWTQWFSKIQVVVSDLTPSEIRALSAAYPNATIVDLGRFASSLQSPVHRVASKTEVWRDLGVEFASRRDVRGAILADIDTVAVRDPSALCSGDFVLTVRSQGFFLNTGVIGLSSGGLASSLLRDWVHQTEVILRTPSLLAQAISPTQPFGAPDQMAIMQLVRAHPGARSGVFQDRTVNFVPCAEFNACENQIDVSRARVYHLKSSLQRFLLERHPLTGARTLADSKAQLLSAISFNSIGLDKIHAALPGFDSRVFHFRCPRFLRSDLSSCWAADMYNRTAADLRNLSQRARSLKQRVLW